MPAIRPVSLVALLLFAVACSSPSGPKADSTQITSLSRSLSAGEQALVGAGNSFAPALLSAINKSQRTENVFISPLSASMALGMAMNGTAGTTFTEMRSTLGFGTT